MCVSGCNLYHIQTSQTTHQMFVSQQTASTAEAAFFAVILCTYKLACLCIKHASSCIHVTACLSVTLFGSCFMQLVSRLNHLGGTLDPHACFLLQRGLKTLPLRVRQQSSNALALARFLQKQPQVLLPATQGALCTRAKKGSLLCKLEATAQAATGLHRGLIEWQGMQCCILPGAACQPHVCCCSTGCCCLALLLVTCVHTFAVLAHTLQTACHMRNSFCKALAPS